MHFLLANEKSLKVRICFMSAVSYFSKLSVLSCRSRKAKSQKSFPLKSARNCPTGKVVRSQKSAKSGKSFHVAKRTVRQRLFSEQISVFQFFTMTPNDRGYGLGRAAGEFPVAIATKEMRAQRLLKAQ